MKTKKMMKLNKIFIVGTFMAFVPSCANPPKGYDGAAMSRAIKAMSENNYNARVHIYTGGRINTFR